MSEATTPVTPEPATPRVREPKAPLPERVVDNKANAAKFKQKWDDLKKQDKEARVHLPGTRKSIRFSHVEVVDNRISVWTSSDSNLPPDFVIVNGPTEVVNEHGIIIEDPLTAIAIAIDGATK